jgi:hypothetical protein
MLHFKSTSHEKECTMLVVYIHTHIYRPTQVKVKGNVHPRTGHEGPEGEQRCSYTLSLTSALDGGGWQTPRPGPLYARERDPVPIV